MPSQQTGAPPVNPRWTGEGRRREIGRKTIHIASLVFPLFVWFAPHAYALAVLLSATVIALAIDIARLRSRWFAGRFYRLFRGLLRGAERRKFVGATFMMIAYLTAYLVFPLHIAVAAMAFNGLGDALAAIVGRRWGRLRLPSGKSVEGIAACWAGCFVIGLVVPGIGWLAALIAALITAGIEVASLPPDDNLWMTLGGGAALWLVLLVV